MAAPSAGGASAGGDPFFFIIAIPFSLFGLTFVLGRFAYKVCRKRRTLYAVTDIRVIAIQWGLRAPDPGRVHRSHPSNQPAH